VARLTTIVDLVINQTMENLIDELSIEGGWIEDDRVTEGRMQFDPTVDEINLFVNVSGEDDPHETLKDGEVYSGFQGITYEVGGGQFIMRRFTVDLKLYMNEQDPGAARKKANEVESRVIRVIRKLQMGYMDDFGESSMFVQYRSSYMNPGGGEGTYIWTGKVKFEVLTYLE
jgi:hypothetical protein